MNLVLADDIAAIEAASYVMTHTTNPLLSSVAIAGAIADYQAAVGEGRADSLFTVNKVQTRFYRGDGSAVNHRSEEHTSELQSLMSISYAVFCLKKKNNINKKQ